jgi:hypothetical protein
MIIHMKALLRKLDKIIELLLEDRETRRAEQETKEGAENERRLVEYAKAHEKRLPAGDFVNGRDAQDRPVRTDGDLVPFNLSATDRALLDDFYNH